LVLFSVASWYGIQAGSTQARGGARMHDRHTTTLLTSSNINYS
jgi:hypothetical protein